MMKIINDTFVVGDFFVSRNGEKQNKLVEKFFWKSKNQTISFFSDCLCVLKILSICVINSWQGVDFVPLKLYFWREIKNIYNIIIYKLKKTLA